MSTANINFLFRLVFIYNPPQKKLCLTLGKDEETNDHPRLITTRTYTNDEEHLSRILEIWHLHFPSFSFSFSFPSFTFTKCSITELVTHFYLYVSSFSSIIAEIIV